MQVTGAVGVGRVKLGDRLVERDAPDEPHRIVRSSLTVESQTVNRNDSGCSTNRLRFEQNQARLSASSQSRLDLLESHLAVESGQNTTDPPQA